jgi:hypothetical protein
MCKHKGKKKNSFKDKKIINKKIKILKNETDSLLLCNLHIKRKYYRKQMKYIRKFIKQVYYYYYFFQ